MTSDIWIMMLALIGGCMMLWAALYLTLTEWHAGTLWQIAHELGYAVLVFVVMVIVLWLPHEVP
jgi:hypothetical protein